jgi:hypothetical protein
MMIPFKTFPLCAAIALSGISGAEADVRVGVQGCNNQYGAYWVMTASPEFAMTWRWFGLGIDGSWAAFTPPDALQNYTLRTRVSFYPMLRIPLRRFFIEAGYGVSQTFRRDEIRDPAGGFRIESGQALHGEFRGSGGVALPLGGSTRLILRGGLARQAKGSRFFFASMGIGFGTGNPRSASDSRTAASPEMETPGPAGAIIPPKLRNISVLSDEDAISMELNSAIEAALIRNGVQVTNWDKIRTAVQDDYLTRSRKVNPRTPAVASFTDSLSRMQVAFMGAKLLPLDAIVETGIRYVYKSYGEDIVVQSASVRLTDAASGQIIWVTEYDSQDTSFSGCKQKLIQDLIKAIRSAPQRR